MDKGNSHCNDLGSKTKQNVTVITNCIKLISYVAMYVYTYLYCMQGQFLIEVGAQHS